MFPIITSGIHPSAGIGPAQGQRKTLTRVGFEPTTFGLEEHCYLFANERQQTTITFSKSSAW